MEVAMVSSMAKESRTPGQEALHQRLASIPAGSISRTARDARMPLRVLNRLRAGEHLDIRLSTLERLAEAFGTTPDGLLGVKPDDASRRAQHRADAEARRRDTETSELL